jgi:hypothetical protein
MKVDCLAQSVELHLYTVRVGGSSPSAVTVLGAIRAPSSIRSELPAHNRQVLGSNPRGPTMEEYSGRVYVFCEAHRAVCSVEGRYAQGASPRQILRKHQEAYYQTDADAAADAAFMQQHRCCELRLFRWLTYKEGQPLPPFVHSPRKRCVLFRDGWTAHGELARSYGWRHGNVAAMPKDKCRRRVLLPATAPSPSRQGAPGHTAMGWKEMFRRTEPIYTPYTCSYWY